MDAIFYWIIDRLIDFLARINPARAKKAEALKTEADRLDGLAKENEKLLLHSQVAFAKSNAERKEWDWRNAELAAENSLSEQRFNDAAQRIKNRNAETEKLNQAVLTRDDDVAFSGVPKSTGH